MSRNIVITIGREVGSGGREIARKVATLLNINYYDKNILDIVAEKSGMHKAVLHKADEKAANPFLSSYMVQPGEYGTINDRLFWTQSAVIKDLASKESFVIVGRCANYVLSDMDRCLRIFIYADDEDRISRIKDRYMLDSADIARKEIKQTDKQRRSYYQYYTDLKWGTSEGMNMLISSSYFGINKTAEMIVDIVKTRWPDYAQKEDDKSAENHD